MLRMYPALAAVLLLLLALLVGPMALAQEDTGSTDPAYLDKLAQLLQYGPSCEPPVGPDLPPLPCADPTAAPPPESTDTSDQSQEPPCGYDYCDWYQACQWEYWAWDSGIGWTLLTTGGSC